MSIDITTDQELIRTTPIQVYLEEADKEMLRKVSKQHRVSMSAFIRLCIIEKFPNLNQLEDPK